MEEKNIVEHFESKTIFITGATGFLGKIFLEKMLRLQPNVKKVFLLIREVAKESVEQRLQKEVIDTELFRVLREERREEFKTILLPKIIPVSGDVSHENLGIIGSELREEMWREVDIIVNSAATTKFDDRYDVAFGINAMGTIHVQDFARKCSRLEILLHVSTAYVHGTRGGLILEKPHRMGETLAGSEISILDIDEEKMIIEEKLKELQTDHKLTEKEITKAMKELGSKRAELHGWPNTYVFTKAMGEMLLERLKEKAYNMVIIRPTMITSTYREPFPGWIEGVRTLDGVFVAYGKGKLKFFVGDPESIADVIPGDMVVNCMIAAIATHSNDKHDLIVYHIASSRQNPIKCGEIVWLMHRYLTENPLLDRSRGKPIRVGKLKTLNSMTSFHNYIAIHYLFLMVLKLINIISCNYFEVEYANVKRRISEASRLAELYKPYLFTKAIFDDYNTEYLRRTTRGNNMNISELNFDPKSIQWDEYFIYTHFPGMAKYVIK